jgi:hypothetical protein
MQVSAGIPLRRSKKTSTGANFPRFILLLGGGDVKAIPAKHTYVKF